MQWITASGLIRRLKYSYLAHSFGSYISLRDCSDFGVTVVCIEDLTNIPWVLQTEVVLAKDRFPACMCHS